MPKTEGKPAPRARPQQGTLIGSNVEADATADDWFTGLDEIEDHANSVLYGREGSGKTTSMCRLVNLHPTGRFLVVNAEGGLKKVALRKRGVDTSRIVVWPGRDSDGNPRQITHKGLVQLANKLAADLAQDPTSWVGVGLDSASEIVQAMVGQVQEKRVNAIRNKGEAVDENHVDRSDYGDMTKMFRDVLRKFRDLPCHVVITALERRDIDNDTGKPQYGPAVTPGLQTDLLGYVDFVLMLKAEDEDGPFRALTRANSRYRAKDRFDVLPRVLAEPMMDRVVGYLHGEITEDEDPFQDDLPDRARKSQDATVPDTGTDADEDEEDDD